MEQNIPQPPRPAMVRVPSTETKYMQMLLHLDRIPRIYNFLSGVFTWILLASFLIIPGTFTSFKNSDTFKNIQDDEDKSNAVAKAIIDSAANVGLLWLSGALCVIGGTGCLFLWFRWRKNYVWIVNKVFLPATLNSIAGLLTTVVNVYTAQKGVWSATAKIGAIVTGCLTAVAGGLFAAYNFWILEKVRDAHEASYYPEEKLGGA